MDLMWVPCHMGLMGVPSRVMSGDEYNDYDDQRGLVMMSMMMVGDKRYGG